jgi:hypothetical protein
LDAEQWEYTASATVFKEVCEEKREPDCGPKQSSGHTKGWGERDERYDITEGKETKQRRSLGAKGPGGNIMAPLLIYILCSSDVGS